jgi:spermidine/putrescine transport system permease protein
MVSASGSLSTPAVAATSRLDRLRGLLLRSETLRGYSLLTPTLLVMAALLIVPTGAMIGLSFCTQQYVDIDCSFTLDNYRTIFEPSDTPAYFLGIPFYLKKPIYLILLLKSILVSSASTLAVVVLAYPMAYFLAFRVTRHKMAWLVIITVPFWTSYLLRVFAWKIILGFQGLINSGFISLGILKEPLEFLLYNPTAVVITLTHAWAAFAILPIYVSLEKIDKSLLEAATDLGDTPRERFWRVTFPLSLPGVVAATLLVYIPTVGDYVTPSLVGGTSGIMVGNLIQSLFGKANNAPLGSALAVVMMVTITLIVIVFLSAIGRKRWKQAE